MSQIEDSVNSLRSEIRANALAKRKLMQKYVLNAQTVTDQMFRDKSKSSSRCGAVGGEFDSSRTRSDSMESMGGMTQRCQTAMESMYDGGRTESEVTARQARGVGTSRVRGAMRLNDGDDPVPTPPPAEMACEVTVSESVEMVSKKHLDSREYRYGGTVHHKCTDSRALAPTEERRPPKKSSSREIDVGSVVAGRYEILSEISRGGFGIVYRARQIGVDRVVALKRLRRQDDPSVNKRFLLESNIIKNLIHPNTIQLIDAGMDDSHLFLVMEYIEGKSLKGVIRECGHLSEDRAIHITRQILKSVNEAHQRGIVHRDLKPSNILLRDIIGESDFVKVLDFGIAKARNIQIQKLTEEGKVMGTPQYLAPELLFGEEACPGADLYAIGLILAEMLMGRPVMPNDLSSIIKMAASPERVPLPKEIVESDLGEIIQKAVEKNPRNRYRSAEEMLADLEDLANYRIATSVARQGNKPYRTLSRTSRRPSRLWRYSLIALAAMLFIMANIYLIHRFWF